MNVVHRTLSSFFSYGYWAYWGCLVASNAACTGPNQGAAADELSSPIYGSLSPETNIEARLYEAGYPWTKSYRIDDTNEAAFSAYLQALSAEERCAAVASLHELRAVLDGNASLEPIAGVKVNARQYLVLRRPRLGLTQEGWIRVVFPTDQNDVSLRNHQEFLASTKTLKQRLQRWQNVLEGCGTCPAYCAFYPGDLTRVTQELPRVTNGFSNFESAVFALPSGNILYFKQDQIDTDISESSELMQYFVNKKTEFFSSVRRAGFPTGMWIPSSDGHCAFAVRYLANSKDGTTFADEIEIAGRRESSRALTCASMAQIQEKLSSRYWVSDFQMAVFPNGAIRVVDPAGPANLLYGALPDAANRVLVFIKRSSQFIDCH